VSVIVFGSGSGNSLLAPRSKGCSRSWSNTWPGCGRDAPGGLTGWGRPAIMGSGEFHAAPPVAFPSQARDSEVKGIDVLGSQFRHRIRILPLGGRVGLQEAG
jgi:hypothetical protein